MMRLRIGNRSPRTNRFPTLPPERP
jgi:hypothetical protein